MQKAFQDMFQYMSQKENWHQSIMLMMFYSLAFMLIGVVLAWIVDKLIKIKRTKPEAFDDLGFTWKGDRFTKIKKVR